MNAIPPSSAARNDTESSVRRENRGSAIPAKLHTGVSFMMQFMSILFVGGYASVLHDRGIHWAVLTAGAIVGGIALLWVVAQLGKLVPVRCKQCGGKARYTGLRWWPFIYYYACRECGHVVKIEMQGR